MDDRKSQIQQRLSELDHAKQSLLEELALLQAQGVRSSYGKPVLDSPASSAEEKISLFLTLFANRTDVFPRLWENKTKNTKSYSPACGNEWVRGICLKPRVKCSDCPNKNYLPLDNEVVRAHLLGKMTIGAYAIRHDDTCTFLAADFDKLSWQPDLLGFKKAATQMGIPVSMERSRSGNGAHAWIFFEKPIPARKARHLGTIILTQASLDNPNVGLESYDRFFPNQDYLPKGGFGNLIALPLQKIPGETGNTLFIDDSLQAFPSQWSFLSDILRISENDVDEILSACAANTMALMSYDSEDAEIQEAETGIDIDFEKIERCHPEDIKLLLGAMINIDIAALPHKLVLALKRTATFANPVFFKKQNPERLQPARNDKYCGHSALPVQGRKARDEPPP
jgi:hypothetical protein